MAQNICNCDDDLKEKLKKFRFQRTDKTIALIMKIENGIILLDEEVEDLAVDDLPDYLPEQQPRFVELLYKFTHSDGRISYPLCFIYISPEGCKPEMQMMYAGSLNNLVKQAGVTKVFELRSIDEITEEWLKEKLSFFR